MLCAALVTASKDHESGKVREITAMPGGVIGDVTFESILDPGPASITSSQLLFI
jgi:hypothetical protein